MNKKIGIYKIVNIKTGKFYLGSSKDIDQRWKIHKKELRSRKHHSAHLQYSWNKHGANAFILEILEELASVDTLKEREQYYLDTLNPWKDKIGYNMCKDAVGNDTLSDHPNKKQIVKKISLSLKKYQESLTQEEKEEIARKISTANKGRKFSKEHKKNKSLAQTGNKNHRFGKSMSEEQKIKISQANKGVNNCQVMSKVSIKGNIYNSISEAVRETGINRGKLRGRLDSKTNKFKDYFYL